MFYPESSLIQTKVAKRYDRSTWGDRELTCSRSWSLSRWSSRDLKQFWHLLLLKIFAWNLLQGVAAAFSPDMFRWAPLLLRGDRSRHGPLSSSSSSSPSLVKRFLLEQHLSHWAARSCRHGHGLWRDTATPLPIETFKIKLVFNGLF